ncbi:MAG: efflux RND transporter periplasmic adaptor subunit [Nitrospinota bacterium]|nr:efflux RND transporter periplasmic adaptor subunit [Nitrospinota bacterium]
MTGAKQEQSHPPKKINRNRNIALSALAAVFVVAGIITTIWWMSAGRYREITDNAYVGGNIYNVEPQVSGTVVWIGADDTEMVKSGQPLVRLGEADLAIGMEKAKSGLMDAVRLVANLRARAAQQKATLASRETDLAKARDERDRRKQLVDIKAVSREDYDRTRAAFQSAESALEAARQDVEAASILAGGGDIASHPMVMSARIGLKEAYLNLRRAVVVAPVDGYVAKRAVQIGQKVAPGRPLMTVIPLNDLWIDANFKETQLKNMRVGQPAHIKCDIYGSATEFTGKVKGFGAGTGGVFALLPAQNATGNWIKIVQRAPVRIQLEPGQYAQTPLILGLSALVTVDTHDRTGNPLSGAALPSQGLSTNAYDAQADGADELVERVYQEAIKAAQVN